MWRPSKRETRFIGAERCRLSLNKRTKKRLWLPSQRRFKFARIVGSAMRACRRKTSKALAQNTGLLDGGYHGGGVNNRQSPSSVFHFALFCGEGLSNHAAEGDGAAAAVAGRHIRIRVGVA